MQVKTCPIRTATVAVADRQPSDYSALLQWALRAEMRLEFVMCGHDALRLARTDGPDFWVINTELPDMSGLDLCTMLRSQLRRPIVYMVTDRYHADDERAARVRGAAFFGAKPIQGWWFDRWSRPPP